MRAKMYNLHHTTLSTVLQDIKIIVIEHERLCFKKRFKFLDKFISFSMIYNISDPLLLLIGFRWNKISSNMILPVLIVDFGRGRHHSVVDGAQFGIRFGESVVKMPQAYLRLLSVFVRA